MDLDPEGSVRLQSVNPRQYLIRKNRERERERESLWDEREVFTSPVYDTVTPPVHSVVAV
jgi:hypothetical protein